MEIYPAIDIKDGKCVRLSQGRFESVTTYSEDPLKMAKRWQQEGAKWLHIVDLDGARTGSPNAVNLQVIRQIIRQVGLPIQYGGGVRSGEIVDRLLNIGASRVVVGTAVAADDALAQGLFRAYGDKIAVGVDAKEGMVAIQGWQVTTNLQTSTYIQHMATLGAQRFIFTDIARDGMLQGINMEALAEAAVAAKGLPVIASGGVSKAEDILSLVELRQSRGLHIEGVIIGKALYANTITLADALANAKEG